MTPRPYIHKNDGDQESDRGARYTNTNTLYIFIPLLPVPTHDLARTLLPLDLRGDYFISQGALAHH